MNQRLLKAAWNGDVDYLLKEVETNPSMLHAVVLEGGENLLHITCLAGHLNFAAAVVKLRQQFSWELNQDGFSPLHLAAACGHGEIVRELLKVDLGLCLIEGKDRKIPLHLAVVKGNVEVISELLSASPDSIECMTAQGETSLHLAVKNNQFKAFQVLVQHLKHVNKEELLNSKDLHGNTILHLAVSKKQYEVVNFLLNGQATSKDQMELNSLNNRGLAPLDVLQMFQSEAGDREIEDLLLQAGALKAENLPSPQYIQESPNHPESDKRHEHTRSPAGKMFDYFKYNKLNESPSEVRGTLLLIVTLITTATYQPVLSPPGGTWQDDSTSTVYKSSFATNNTAATKPHVAGQSIMSTRNTVSFGVFLYANSVGFYTSLHLIYVLTTKFPLRMELHVLLVAISTTYSACITAIAPYNNITIGFIVIAVILPFFLPIATIFLRNHLKWPRNASANTSQGRV